jgi:hypothetical protein
MKKDKKLTDDEFQKYQFNQDIKPKLIHRAFLRWDTQKRALIPEDEKYRSFYHYTIE